MTHILLLGAAILSFSFSLRADVVLPDDPRRNWLILETEHFEIIYDKNQKNLAEHFANEAERAHKLLQPLLKISVPSKVPVVLADITDSSNGAAMGVPRSEIEIYPVLPSVTDPTGEYYDWDREVIQHEYTHILNFEPTSGFMGILRTLFGSIIKPGGYLPRWYTEGLAVEMESRLTPLGRGRSHYYSGFIRSQVEDGSWGKETIDRLQDTAIPTWPRGQRPYTYGHFLLHELSEFPNYTHSQDSVYGILDTRFGGRLPWFINGPMEDYFGNDWAALLAATYETLEVKATNQLKILKATNSGKPLAQSGYFNFGAQISPDGLKLAAIISAIDESTSIKVWQRSSPTQPFTSVKEPEKTVIKSKNIHQLAWLRDSKHLIYDHSEIWQHFNTYNDLFSLDINTGKEERLTYGLRAREASVLPDGSLVFVVATPTNTLLEHSDPQGKTITTLLAPGFGERISAPRPYLDGVIYSRRDNKGKEWIEYLSLKDPKKIPTVLTRAEKVGQMHIMPIADKKSPTRFYFASADSGVMNIYSNDGSQTVPLTNIASYATSPEIDVSGNQIIYSRLTGDGFRLEAQDLSTLVSSPQSVGSLETFPKAEEGNAPRANIVSQHSYNGLSYLFPQYLIPFIYFVPGGALFDLSTSIQDPLKQHALSLDVGYDTRAQSPHEQILYTNATLPFFIDAGFANNYIYLVGAGITEQYTYASLDTRHFLFSDSNRWFIGPEFTYSMTIYGTSFVQMGPGAFIEYDGVVPSRDYQISPEAGQSFRIGYDYFLPNLGNTSFPNVNGTASFYFSGRPLPKHHVISTKFWAWVSPPLNTIFAGTQQGGGEYPGSFFAGNFLARGYPVGEFLGYRMFSGTFEYRFPIAYQYSGQDTLPFFFEKWHGAVVADAITLDGGYYNNSLGGQPNLFATQLGRMFWDAGAELRADTFVVYGYPLTFRLGAYYGLTQVAYGGWNYYLGFGLIQ